MSNQTPTPSDLGIMAPALVAAFAARYPKLPPLQTELSTMGLGTPYQGPQQVLLVWCDKWKALPDPETGEPGEALRQTVYNQMAIMYAVQPITDPPTFNVDGLAINIATAFAYEAYYTALNSNSGAFVSFNDYWVRPASLKPSPVAAQSAYVNIL